MHHTYIDKKEYLSAFLDKIGWIPLYLLADIEYFTEDEFSQFLLDIRNNVGFKVKQKENLLLINKISFKNTVISNAKLKRNLEYFIIFQHIIHNYKYIHLCINKDNIKIDIIEDNIPRAYYFYYIKQQQHGKIRRELLNWIRNHNYDQSFVLVLFGHADLIQQVVKSIYESTKIEGFVSFQLFRKNCQLINSDKFHSLLPHYQIYQDI